MTIVRRNKKSSSPNSSSSSVLLGSCCCGVLRCLSQFVVVLTWGLTGLALGVLLVVYRHASHVQDRANIIANNNNNNRMVGRNTAAAAAAPPLPLGPDGLPSLSALLEKQQRGGSLRAAAAAVRDTTTSTTTTTSKQYQQQQQQQIERNNAALNPNHCPLPPNSKIVEIPANSVADYDLKLAVWSDGDFLSDTIASKKAWEIESIDDVAALADSGTLPDQGAGAFYDIGANVGYYAFLFASAGYPSVAVEPDPGNAALIRASICLNQDQLKVPVQLRQVALTSAAEVDVGGCRLAARVNSRTQKYLHAAPRLFCPAPAEPCDPGKDKVCVNGVPVATFRQLLLSVTTEDDENDNAPLPAPSIVKIDVEGHELQVLQGLLLPGGGNNNDNNNNEPPFQQLLPHAIQFENKDPRVVDALRQLLESAGYKVGTARGHDQNTVAERTAATTTTVAADPAGAAVASA